LRAARVVASRALSRSSTVPASSVPNRSVTVVEVAFISARNVSSCLPSPRPIRLAVTM